MPAKNTLKLYVENGFYHMYNRGVEKRKIFLDEQDYKVFLHFLKQCLSPLLPIETLGPIQIRKLLRKNFAEEIKLLTYNLRPNHFHLLIKQKSKDAIEKFMRSLGTRYVIYFNRRWERSGHLFQGRYKAVLVKTDEQLLHLSRYIHINSLEDKKYPLEKMRKMLLNSYSSYGDYLGKRVTDWLHPEEILVFFKTGQRRGPKDLSSYQSFVEDYINDDRQKALENLTLE